MNAARDDLGRLRRTSRAYRFTMQPSVGYAVRTAVEEDLAGVLRLHNERTESAADAALVEPSERQRQTWGQMLATDGLRVYVAEADGQIVGNTCLLTVPNLGYECKPTAFLEPMRVALGYRRRGIGRLMVERLLADARSAGCYKVQLLSHKRHAHDGAHSFYQSMGFEAEAEGFRRYLT
jgi:GNAT superfamily N-acetyltransferase